jgi:class 3 adenylate cyclase/tetratricopeptide (TPR) repeat protein
MLCRYCNSDNSVTNAFCETCGKPLQIVCAACGHINGPTSRFCGKCSTPLNVPSRRPAAEELLRVLSVTGGERKQLTVVFADISNSTGLIQYADPEDAMHRIQPAIDAMRRCVERYDGIVNKVQGDGVMALFGAPVPREDHAVRACAAALAIQASVAELGDPDLKIRVGMHSGEVILQAVVNSLYHTYDVSGSAAHLAARMEQMATPGEILLTGVTAAAARNFVEATSLGFRSVRGVPEPIEIFRLERLHNAPASVIFRSQPTLSPLIGRGAQLDFLEAELASAAAGEPRAVGVVGEAGSGKSRLCFEFAERCRERGYRVFEARVTAHGHATPYQPILELARDYLGILPNMPPDEARERVASVMSAFAVDDETLPLLLGFLGLVDPAQSAAQLDPAMRKKRLVELLRLFVRSGQQVRPALILIEDLHWIDAASEEFIDVMADAIIGTKTMLLFNLRHGYSAPWMQRSHYRQINLSPLGPAEAQGLLSKLLGSDSSLALVSRNIAQRAQGNPFFLEELVRCLVERGDFEGERGNYRLAGGIGEIPLPPTIEALLAARIDHLDEPARRVLQYAAVIGREAPLNILEAVTGLPAPELADALGRLRRAELLRELALDPGVHAFSHPLVQEVCYRVLLRERRRGIHADVAGIMKLHFADRKEERASLLAYHLEEAGQTMEAAQAHIRAAMWIGTHDSSQALRSWRKVHHLLEGQPVSESIGYLRMQCCIQVLTFGWREGISAEEARRWFEEARQLALAAGNARANAWIHAAYGRNLAVSGSADDYVARIREALALATEMQDRSAEAMMKAVLSQAVRLSGRLDEALQANIEATDRADAISEFDRQLFSFDVRRWLTVMRGQVLVQLGRFDDARPYLDRMLQTDTDSNDITLHLVSLAYVDMAWATKEKTLAEFHAERAMKMATESGSPYILVNALACLGVSHLVAGRFAAAVDSLDTALSVARSRKAGLESEARILADLANAHRLNNELEAAQLVAAEAIEVAVARAARVPECLGRLVQADVLRQAGRIELARFELAQARGLMEATGAKLYAALLDEVTARFEEDVTPARDVLPAKVRSE